MSLHSEHCRNEETFFISVKPETLHTDFLLFFSLFYPSAIFVDLFFLSRFFFFLFNLSRLRKRSIDVITSPRIVTFQSVLFVLNWPIALTTPSFHASLFSFFSLLSLNYLILLDSERTILSLAKLFFFFLSLDLCADSTKRDYILTRKRNVRKAWSDRISVEESRNCLTNLEAASGRSGLIALPPIAHTLLKRFERLTR